MAQVAKDLLLVKLMIPTLPIIQPRYCIRQHSKHQVDNHYRIFPGNPWLWFNMYMPLYQCNNSTRMDMVVVRSSTRGIHTIITANISTQQRISMRNSFYDNICNAAYIMIAMKCINHRTYIWLYYKLKSWLPKWSSKKFKKQFWNQCHITNTVYHQT